MFGSSKPFLGLRGRKLNIAIAAVAGVDMLLFGFDQGVVGGVLTLDSFTSTFPEICTTTVCTAGMSDAAANRQSVLQGVSVSSYNLGCFVGALLTIFLGDRLGRKRCIFGGSLIMAVGAVLQCSAFALPQLIVGRVICGIGNGINTSTVPVWQAECSKSHRRGPTVMAELCIVVGGVALSYWLDYAFSFLEPSSAAWRVPIAFQLLFTLTVLATILFMPESPRWLVLQQQEDREAEALDVLCAIYDCERDDAFVNAELEAVRVVARASTQGTFQDLFTMGKTKNMQRTLLAYGIQVMQQITGINLITYYAATIYENEIGLSGNLSRILAACNGLEYFIAMFPAIFLVERIGRRPLLLVGSVGMALTMAVLAISTSIASNSVNGNTAAGIVAAVFLFVFNTFFALGWCGLPWLIPTELLPLEIRAKASALATSADWIFNFLVVMITPVAFHNIGWRTYIVFAVFNAAIIPVVYLFYPETMGRSLEEMDLIFAKSTGWLDTVRKAKTMPRHFGKNGEVLRDMLPEVREELEVGEEAPKLAAAEASHVEK
ncbi:hypothetical protein SEUCBS140593_009756 [Sporothrix eucalyptigena]|uniref:Major facilitator superfamily (MFS) profile domain-containing protein n=1 Tax=Sporothrix eucalyptigena TaxID=1812306 RepID=A0ABP0CXH6_9PEZI